MTRYAYLPLLALGTLLLAGCLPEDNKPAASNKSVQSDRAREAANSINFTENAEIDNIRRRLELTSSPGKIGYIVLMNQAGQPIIYEGVRGKVTSGNKRLTEPDRVTAQGAGGSNGGYAYQVRQAPSDEGTYGSSSPYIFYWTSDGAYRQWSGDYLYSDQPIRLRVSPLVVSVQDAAAK